MNEKKLRSAIQRTSNVTNMVNDLYHGEITGVDILNISAALSGIMSELLGALDGKGDPHQNHLDELVRRMQVKK